MSLTEKHHIQSKRRPLNIDSDIMNYVLSVGVRFLCGFSDKDSLETILQLLDKL